MIAIGVVIVLGERERVAQEQVQQAKESRKVAAEVGARADQVDPDRAQPDEE